LTAIQILEQELVNFMKQREQAVANVHAVEGAIQAAQHLIGKLKAEAAAAETEAKKLFDEAEAEAKKVFGDVEAEAKKL
jgi:nucleoside diphosphate kinase